MSGSGSGASKKDSSLMKGMINHKAVYQLTVVYVDEARYHLPDQHKINKQIKDDLKKAVEE